MVTTDELAASVGRLPLLADREGTALGLAAEGCRFDACVHAVAIALAALAAPALLLDPRAGGSTALGLYAVALAVLFVASAAFHHGPASWRRITIRIDHSAIYLKIASSYGALVAVSGVDLGNAVAGLWAIAALGAALRVAGPDRMRAASLSLYLVVTLGGLVTIWPALAALSPEAGRLVTVGGGVYLVGLVFHLADGLRLNQAIWHGCVLVATGAIYAAVLIDLGAGVVQG